MPCFRVLALLLLIAPQGFALVLGNGKQEDGPDSIDTRAIARIHTPNGLLASGTLLSGGRYILTAAHVVRCHADSRLSLGIVDFPSLPNSPRRHWKQIHLHPKALDPKLGKVWDVALIELDQPIPTGVHPGLEIIPKTITHEQAVLLSGFGRRGTGKLGDYQSHGSLTLGINHFDLPLDSKLRELLRLPPGPLPLLLHRFDVNSAEAHFATGDSGGAGLIQTPDGRTLIASVNLARHRGSHDADHRLNGSFGEIGLSLDASAIQPWLSQFTKHQNTTPKTKQ